MTIKERLKLSYAAMLMIPIILMVFAGVLISGISLSEERRQILKQRNPIEELLNLNQTVSSIVNRQILDNPDAFMEA